jgi:hypothetical protein
VGGRGREKKNLKGKGNKKNKYKKGRKSKDYRV